MGGELKLTLLVGVTEFYDFITLILAVKIK